MESFAWDQASLIYYLSYQGMSQRFQATMQRRKEELQQAPVTPVRKKLVTRGGDGMSEDF